MNRPKVVILGGGFGGLAAARALYKDADVTVVDRHNYQTFLPLLYQVSTAGLAADHVAYPIRGALRKTSVKFRMASPINIDHRNKEVKLDSSEILKFDHLIVALGSVSADFGIPGVKEFSLGMKSVSEALTIRAEIMRRFEDLCRFEDDTKFSVTVIGGGPTGVEMAGAIAELIRGPLKSDQAQVAKNINVTLIEAGPRLLPPFAPSLSARTKKDLEKLGVKVLLNTAVKELAHRKILLKDGTTLQSEITIWAAGVKAPDFLKNFGGLETNKLNQIVVQSTLQSTLDSDIFALGDCAACPCTEEEGGRAGIVPPRAQAAHQQATHMYRQIQRRFAKKSLKPYHYKDFGSLVSLGKFSTVGNMMGGVIGKNLMIEGYFAKLMYLSLYKLHELTIHGFLKTALYTLARMLTKQANPTVKLH